jgi:hypothetical protein
MYQHHKHLVLASLIGGLALSGLVACGGTGGEPSTFVVTVENISDAYSFLASGAHDIPMGSDMPGEIGPGEAYEHEFYAGPEQRLTFALMFVESNDFFYAPDEDGIALFDGDGNPINGDITSEVLLWDAGTEINQELGVGPDQAPRQSEPNTGDADPDDTVRLADDPSGNLPAVSEVLRATLTSGDGNHFTLRIENVSTTATLPLPDGTSIAVPLSPMAYVLHTESAPLFTAGEPDRGMGLETLAEDGDPWVLAAALEPLTGLATALSPGVYAVHHAGKVLFIEGQADLGYGMESLAEDGDPSAMNEALGNNELVIMHGIFDMPVGGGGATGQALPGDSYSFTIEAMPGDYLSFATMLVQSNDFFFAPSDSGMALFDSDNNPIGGDVTMDIAIWDAGTEVNQALGAGPDQAPRQAAPDTGEDENGAVERVTDPNVQAADQLIRVTISDQ